ncbi:hypothetical protein [Streptomyces sp. ML-6]|uniref:hypothetical protein n=1 Tax=Streptomyces sp. ML-6 TaxID=2982693 RepID=UPI0024BF8425|nr:hypothetical protein [Streptomyces sp. ML-6]MDK0520894.1 hypothetical protein [Streptomyces sp. ML-6]
MHKYVINKDFGNQREVEATGFATVGDYIDFYGVDDRGDKIVTLRIRAARVETVERLAS